MSFSEGDLQLIAEVEFVPRDRVWWLPFKKSSWWTTWRSWFGGRVFIFHPADVEYPFSERHEITVKHELVHVRQFQRYGTFAFLMLYLLFPLPILLSGRWWLERDAYLVSLQELAKKFPGGGEDLSRMVDLVVSNLWRRYGWVYPKKWMREWFLDKLRGTP